MADVSRARAVLIANPTAGLGRTRRLAPLLARALAARGLEVELLFTAGAPDAAEAARSAVTAGCERVIVAGGDGAVSSVVGALAHTPACLGLIPTGTANAFARELGIPRRWSRACDIAAGREVRMLDVGRAAGRHFAAMAGVGFDAHVVAAISPRLKRRLGAAAYVLTGVGCARGLRPTQMRLTWDDGELSLSALMVVAANAAHYTYEWRLARQARPDDGVLDVVVFPWRRALDPAAHVLGALAGVSERSLGVVALRTRRLRIECDPPAPVQLDGDPAGETPVEVEVHASALRVLAPLP